MLPNYIKESESFSIVVSNRPFYIRTGIHRTTTSRNMNITQNNFTMAAENNTTSPVLRTLPHAWYQFNGYMLCIISVFACIANILVVYVFLKDKQLRIPDNVFIISVAVGDIGMACVIPLAALSSIYEHWITGKLGCTVDAFGAYFIGMSEIYSITAMAFQRYKNVTSRNSFLKKLKQTIITLILVWSAGLFWAIIPLTGVHSYGFEGVNVSCGLDWARNDTNAQVYIILLFVFGFSLPVGIILFSYITIYKTAVGVQAKIGDVRTTKRRQPVIVKTASLITCGFFIAWTPYAIVYFCTAFGNVKDIPAWLVTTPAIFAKCSCFWNPFIYAGTHRNFRKAFIGILPCKMICNTQVKESAINAVNAAGTSSVTVRRTITPEPDNNARLESHTSQVIELK